MTETKCDNCQNVGWYLMYYGQEGDPKRVNCHHKNKQFHNPSRHEDGAPLSKKNLLSRKLDFKQKMFIAQQISKGDQIMEKQNNLIFPGAGDEVGMQYAQTPVGTSSAVNRSYWLPDVYDPRPEPSRMPGTQYPYPPHDPTIFPPWIPGIPINPYDPTNKPAREPGIYNPLNPRDPNTGIPWRPGWGYRQIYPIDEPTHPRPAVFSSYVHPNW